RVRHAPCRRRSAWTERAEDAVDRAARAHRGTSGAHRRARALSRSRRETRRRVDRAAHRHRTALDRRASVRAALNRLRDEFPDLASRVATALPGNSSLTLVSGRTASRAAYRRLAPPPSAGGRPAPPAGSVTQAPPLAAPCRFARLRTVPMP